MDFSDSNLPTPSKLAYFPILPLARKVQITLQKITYGNFQNYPRKTYKFPVRSPYYMSLWHSYNSQQYISVRIFSLHPVNWFIWLSTYESRVLKKINVIPRLGRFVWTTTFEQCELYNRLEFFWEHSEQLSTGYVKFLWEL